MKSFIALFIVLLSAPAILGRAQFSLSSGRPSSSQQTDYAPQRCRDGESWYDGCNNCFCANGIPACTLRYCPPRRGGGGFGNRFARSVGDQNEDQATEPLCLPHSEWSDGCNRCFCLKGGIPACTKKLCPPGELRDPNAFQCTDGSRFKRDCNVCECVNGNIVCTEKACVKEDERDCENTSNTPGRWRKDCNWCTCTEKGLGMCTLRACFGEKDTTSSDCEGDIRWKDNCNWCRCVNGRGVCTRRACFKREEIPALDKEESATEVPTTQADNVDRDCENTSDTPGRWRKDCNWCTCSEKGLGMCTLRGCFGERDTTSPDCEGDIRWKDDCNWCRCVNGRGVCTRKACFKREEFPALNRRISATDVTATSAPSPTEAERDCENFSNTPGRWRKDCNWCTCTEKGLGMCTLRACFGEADPTLPDCEGDFRWKEEDGCNWCRCHNGTGACTRRGCLTEDFLVTPDEPECLGDARWKKDCNFCHCEEGKAVCTDLPCEEENNAGGNGVASENSLEVGTECSVGSSWHDGCNLCRCTSTGLSICSRKACPNPRTVVNYSCSQGSQWRVGCNTCSCVDGAGICTARACATRSNHVENSEPQQCEEGTSFNIECNTCTCTNGLPVCTRKACISEVEPPKNEEETCVEGTSWFDGCNTCFCSRGFSVCTYKACIHLEEKPEETDLPVVESSDIPDLSTSLFSEDKRYCVPGSRFRLNECNWCSCTETGISMCTLKACDEEHAPSEITKDCEGNARWKKDCNWCNCVDGFGVCTKMVCRSKLSARLLPIPTEVQEITERTLDETEECISGSHWRDDCNWCNCNGGRAACTKRGCPSAVFRDSSDCSKGSVWREDCNTCTCNEEGFSACTRKLCSTTNIRKLSASEDNECSPGSQWKEECNTCSCTSTGIQVCTRKLCTEDSPAPSTMYEGECLDGSHFTHADGCNSCFCHNGFAACTRMMCISHPVAAVPAVATAFRAAALPRVRLNTAHAAEDATPDEGECEEGKQWQEDCNTCFCNGGMSLCTTRACAVSPPQSSESNKEKCSHPAESGPCFAALRKFKFNVERNRCEMFLYGGCGGNSNRFSTMKDCFDTCGGDAPVVDSKCDRKACPESRQNSFMAAKGCKPVYKEGSCCATGYECQEIAPPVNPNNCVVKSKEYQDGEYIPAAECNICSCRGGSVECISKDCPSHFGINPFQGGGNSGSICRRRYTLNSCCSVGENCDDAPICFHKGKEYYRGSKMYFDGPDSSQKCICEENFNGPYGPGCKTIDCLYDTHYATRIAQGCVPRYYKQRWCPIGFICPDSGDIAQEQENLNPNEDIEDLCYFGDYVLAKGLSLKTTNENVKCECLTPPTITCVKSM